MSITQEQYNAAVLEVTSGPAWDVVKQGFANDIYQSQASALDAENWGAVCELRGFARGIAYVMRIRETIKVAMDQEAANANL